MIKTITNIVWSEYLYIRHRHSNYMHRKRAVSEETALEST
jgi:hypothetical protein